MIKVPGAISKIQNNNDIITRPPFVPAMKCDNFVEIIDQMTINMLPS